MAARRPAARSPSGIASILTRARGVGNFPSAIRGRGRVVSPKGAGVRRRACLMPGRTSGALCAPAGSPGSPFGSAGRALFWPRARSGPIWLIFWFALYEDSRAETSSASAGVRPHLSDPRRVGPRQVPLETAPRFPFRLGRWFIRQVPDGFHKVELLAREGANSRFGLTLSKLGPPLIVTYLIADIGSVGGGWGSLALIRRGWTVPTAAARTVDGRSRRSASCPSSPPRARGRLGPPFFSSPWQRPLHQAWSANIFTFPSDMNPKQAVGSVTGLGGTAGGSILFAASAGHVIPISPGATRFCLPSPARPTS